MAESIDNAGDQVAKFKQEVFSKLAFLGMPHGDVAALRHLWKLVNLSAKLGTENSCILNTKPEVQKLVKALTKELGAPRAGLFVRWLVDKIHVYFSRKIIVPAVVDTSTPEQVLAATAASDKQGDCSVLAAPCAVQVIAPAESSTCEGKTSGICSESAAPATLVTYAEDRGVPAPSAGLPSAARCEKDGVCVEVPKQEQPSCTDAVDEAWVEVKAKNGKTYYWDRRSHACRWDLPTGIKAKWVSYKSLDGRTYYSDRQGNSFWVMPPMISSDGSAEKASKDAKETHAAKVVKRVLGAAVAAAASTSGTPVTQCNRRVATSTPAPEDTPPLQPPPADRFFLPEVGVLRPVALPPKSIPSASAADLGPFEAAFEPETPVLQSAASDHRSSAWPSAISVPQVSHLKAESDAPTYPMLSTTSGTPSANSATKVSRCVEDEKNEKSRNDDNVKKDLQIKASSGKLPRKSPESENIREELLSLKKQLAELKEQQSAIVSTAKENESGALRCETSTEAPRADSSNKENNQARPEDLPKATMTSNAQTKDASKKASEDSCRRRTSKLGTKVVETSSEQSSGVPDDAPLPRRRAVPVKTDSHPSAHQKEKAWELWSHEPERKPEAADKSTRQFQLDDEQQKSTDEYLASFGADLEQSPSQEKDEHELFDKKRPSPARSAGPRKKPRNALDFWSQGVPHRTLDRPSATQTDTKRARSESSNASVRTRLSADSDSGDEQDRIPISRRSRSRSSRRESRSKDSARSRSRSPQEKAENKNVLDKFLTLVRYGAPPGSWDPSTKMVPPSGNLSGKTLEQQSVFEIRQHRRPSFGGA
jgi:hypothetical protein